MKAKILTPWIHFDCKGEVEYFEKFLRYKGIGIEHEVDGQAIQISNL